MTKDEVYETIQAIPLGTTLELTKKTGAVIEVRLVSHEVEPTEKKDYGSLEVPALPPAIIVQGGTRFGNFRIDVEEIVAIARKDI
jgi:hypothetical protein